MTSVKRRIVAFVGAALMAGTMFMSANAYTYIDLGETIGNVKTYTKQVKTSSSYGQMYCGVKYTSVSTTSNGQSLYNGSWKSARYYAYYASGNKLEVLYSEIKNGNSFTETTNSSVVTDLDAIAYRSHNGYLHTNSNSSSPLVERYRHNIRKTGVYATLW